jgi:hypothetical protein
LRKRDRILPANPNESEPYMNSSIRPHENEQIEKYVAEIKSLYKEGNLRLTVRMLDVFKRIPKELHEIAINVIIQTAGISSSYYKAGLKFLTWKRDSLPLNSMDRERLLSTFLDVVADPDRQDYEDGELRELSKIDDPRVFETLVKIYKNDKFPERKKEVIYALGRRGKEDALPILLDYIHRQNVDLLEAEISLLEKYPVSERTDLIHIIDMGDRDKVAAKFIKYLQDKNEHNDDLRTAIAHTLAILYESRTTSIKSKELIKASENLAICYGYDEYGDDPVGYIYLKEFVNFGENDNL